MFSLKAVVRCARYVGHHAFTNNTLSGITLSVYVRVDVSWEEQCGESDQKDGYSTDSSSMHWSPRVFLNSIDCAMCRGAADYLVLAGQCSALYLQDVPMFTYAMRNEARRFISLIDALYENKYVLHACTPGRPGWRCC